MNENFIDTFFQYVVAVDTKQKRVDVFKKYRHV